MRVTDSFYTTIDNSFNITKFSNAIVMPFGNKIPKVDFDENEEDDYICGMTKSPDECSLKIGDVLDLHHPYTGDHRHIKVTDITVNTITELKKAYYRVFRCVCHPLSMLTGKLVLAFGKVSEFDHLAPEHSVFICKIEELNRDRS